MGRFSANGLTAAAVSRLDGRMAPRPPTHRARVSNRTGKQLFLKTGHPNEYTAWGRRLKDLIADHLSDLGGLEATTTSEQALVRRAANLILQCEMLEAKWAANDGQASEKSLIVYQRTASALRRILEALGLQRRSRDITPKLDQYLAEKYGTEEENDAAAAE